MYITHVHYKRTLHTVQRSTRILKGNGSYVSKVFIPQRGRFMYQGDNGHASVNYSVFAFNLVAA